MRTWSKGVSYDIHWSYKAGPNEPVPYKKAASTVSCAICDAAQNYTEASHPSLDWSGKQHMVPSVQTETAGACRVPITSFFSSLVATVCKSSPRRNDSGMRCLAVSVTRQMQTLHGSLNSSATAMQGEPPDSPEERPERFKSEGIQYSTQLGCASGKVSCFFMVACWWFHGFNSISMGRITSRWLRCVLIFQ